MGSIRLRGLITSEIFWRVGSANSDPPHSGNSGTLKDLQKGSGLRLCQERREEDVGDAKTTRSRDFAEGWPSEDRGSAFEWRFAALGKTHLAVAIGYRAIQNGFETLCTTAAELVEELSNASKKGRLQESLLTYTRLHVLVVDEVGYLTYGPDAANVLFHVVNDRHLRKRPMIFTTNKPLSERGKVLHDEDLAAAILDRVLERGRFIHLDGPSGRTRHLNLEEALPAAAERARISGTHMAKYSQGLDTDGPLSMLRSSVSSYFHHLRPRVYYERIRRFTHNQEKSTGYCHLAFARATKYVSTPAMVAFISPIPQWQPDLT
jgi:hypothetical protein